MLDINQFREYIVRPTLKFLHPEIPYSVSAENLLMGTAAHESKLTYVRQIGAGPARGLFQIEPATELDNWKSFLAFRSDLRLKIERLSGVKSLDLTGNLPYQVAHARIKYWRDPAPLPDEGDIAAMAETWKRVYNTAGGAGTVNQFIDSYPIDLRKSF